LVAGALLFSALTPASGQPVAPPSSPVSDSTTDAPKGDVVKMDKFVANADDAGMMPTGSSKSAFGFEKTATETPRAITVIPDIQLQQMNITKSEDLAKAVPGTYTNFRFGLQGTVSIRNQTSDFFFNGMKRIDPQGIFESVWGAYDSLEVVEGPEPQIYGLGRMGGYVNFVPKSARATNNQYISSDAGSVSVQYGSFNTLIAKIDFESPFTLFGKPGGVSVFFEDKDADGYKANGFSQQRLLQAGFSVDLTPELRLQAGLSYQISHGGLPGGDNRTTYDTISTQTYWSGNFSYKMDENGDGKIDEKEFRDSYFRGTPQQTIAIPANPTYTNPANYSLFTAASSSTVSLVNGAPSATAPGLFRPSLYFSAGNNDPLFRTIPWQGGTLAPGAGTWTQDGGLTQHTGNISLTQFLAGYTDAAGPALVGQAPVQRAGFQMMFYPTQSDNFANYIPGTTKSGQVPYTGIKYAYWLPPAFDLNASSFQREKWNKRQSIGEDYYTAHVAAFYVDLINDTNPDHTIKNQIFVDTNDQTKSGSNAYSQTQHPTTFEDKMTGTKKFQPFSWWKIQGLASASYWQCWTALVQNSGDSDIDFRRDLQIDGPNGNTTANTFTPNDRWYSMTESSSFVNGLPVGANNQSQYSVTGTGVELDQTFFGKLSITAGARYDYVDAHAYIPPGVMDLGSTGSLGVYYLGPQNVASSAVGGPSTYIGGTGSYIPFAQTARGNASGGSWSASLSYAGPFDIHPYVTYAADTVLLNNTGSEYFAPQSVKNALLGQSILFEAGVKGTIGKNVYYMFSYYNQYRAAFSPLTTVGGGAGNTISRGEEAKIVYSPFKRLTLSVSGNWSLVHNEQGASVTEPASAFGVPNVVNGNGQIVIPADAWAWGGRIQTTIPDSEPRFRRAPGIPAAIISSNANFDIGKGLYIGGTFFYQSAMALDRLDTLWVPKGHTFDGVVGYRDRKWELAVNVTNIFNANIYNFAGFAYWVDPKFQRGVSVTLTRHF
jgi:hypothetical protein